MLDNSTFFFPQIASSEEIDSLLAENVDSNHIDKLGDVMVLINKNLLNHISRDVSSIFRDFNIRVSKKAKSNFCCTFLAITEIDEKAGVIIVVDIADRPDVPLRYADLFSSKTQLAINEVAKERLFRKDLEAVLNDTI